jgi:hypothetical protein
MQKKKKKKIALAHVGIFDKKFTVLCTWAVICWEFFLCVFFFLRIVVYSIHFVSISCLTLSLPKSQLCDS